MSRPESKAKLDLEKVIFIGRTYEEYMKMFSLSDGLLEGKRILDCPAGACSFTSIGQKKGLNITACDIVYDHSLEDLMNKGQEDIAHTMEHMEMAKTNYIWDYFKNIHHLKEHRQRALKDCAADMDENSQRYIPVDLPSLPFKDKEFDILLSAHFLFTYADRLDFEFHMDTLKELLRVTKEEIRIFPLVDLEGNKYKHLDKVIRYLIDNDCLAKEVEVPYEFQAQANSMLKIKKMH